MRHQLTLLNTTFVAIRQAQQLVVPNAASQEYNLYWEYARNQSELCCTHDSPHACLPACPKCLYSSSDLGVLEYLHNPELSLLNVILPACGTARLNSHMPWRLSECLRLLGLQACGSSTIRTPCDCHRRPHLRKSSGLRICQLANSEAAAQLWLHPAFLRLDICSLRCAFQAEDLRCTNSPSSRQQAVDTK